MNRGVKELLAAAEAAVPRISPEAARRQVAEHDALIVDVREADELAERGKVEGAVHVPRGLLEFRADPDSPLHDPEFRRDRTVILYCAVGGRSALAGMALQAMGYSSVFNLGSFPDWVDSGGTTDRIARLPSEHKR
ncbi:rhodanese-like domain-containing protein [Variovorax sp. PAMC 28711]|uniref:rhodanese-like domain-containing protein n=1 Tax=Variovorax sp. PAMC 28711 TaxID=1795631 RepID=UPI00078EE71C|nr:rhodanese-like domain-containing protein [Variovorax sp. PAMC 28711]AMM26323.1 rhodanese [Variovorax sp. PAMC 28711]